MTCTKLSCNFVSGTRGIERERVPKRKQIRTERVSARRLTPGFVLRIFDESNDSDSRAGCNSPAASSSTSPEVLAGEPSKGFSITEVSGIAFSLRFESPFSTSKTPMEVDLAKDDTFDELNYQEGDVSQPS